MKFLLDKKFRYRTAAQTSEAGYLKRRFDAIRRLQRMQSRKQCAAAVTTLPLPLRKSHG